MSVTVAGIEIWSSDFFEDRRGVYIYFLFNWSHNWLHNYNNNIGIHFEYI